MLKFLRALSLTLAFTLSLCGILNASTGQMPIDRFAQTLIDAGTDEERAALLDNNKQLVTVELRKKLIEKGNQLVFAHRTAAAMIVFRLAQMVAERIDDQDGIGHAQLGLGDAYLWQDNPDRALRHYRNALARFEAMDNKARQAFAHKSIGSLFLSQGSYKQALESFEKQLSLFEEVKDETGIAGAYEDIASTRYEMEDYTVAMEFYDRCLKLREKIGNRKLTGATIKAIGNAYYHQQDFGKAIDYYKRALAIYEELKDRQSAAAALNSLGSSYYSQAEYDAALEQYEKSFIIEEEIRDSNGAATSLLGIGLVYYARGDYAMALEYFHRNVAILESLRNKTDLAVTLHNIALAHFYLQNHALALDYHQKCLVIYEELKALPEIASTLTDIGGVNFILGHRDAALERYRRALSIYESQRIAPAVAGLLAAIADVHFAERKLDEALDGFRKALTAYESLGNKERIAAMLNRIGGVHFAKGDFSTALEYAGRAERTAREAGSLDILWQARFTAGVANRALDKKAEARKALEESVSIIETMRARIRGSDYDRPRFSADKPGPYLALVELAASEGRSVEAYDCAEKLKMLSHWDLVRSGRIRINKSMTEAEDERERGLIKAVVSLGMQIRRERQRKKPDSKRLSELSVQFEKRRQDLDAFERRILSMRPGLRSYRGEMSPLRIDQAARLIPDRKTALLSYTMTDAQTFLFVMTRPGPGAAGETARRSLAVDMRTYVLNIPFAELNDRVRQLRQAMADPSAEHRETARWLYDAILKPAEEQLAGRTKLVIAPDSVLWGVPFHALESSEGRFIVEDYEVVYASSLTALAEMSKRRPGARPARAATTRMVAFMNPLPAKELIDRIKLYHNDVRIDGLSESDAEAKQLASIYGERASRIYKGQEAVEDRIKTETRAARVLHVAAPAIISGANPFYSLVLMSAPMENSSQDGAFQVWEIMQLDLNLDLAVFSNCLNTQPHPSNGDGITALTWAMFIGGWQTGLLGVRNGDGAGSSQLMIEFHRVFGSRAQKGSSPVRPAAAFRQAVLNLLRDKQYSHPFYWAGFYVTGAAR